MPEPVPVFSVFNCPQRGAEQTYLVVLQHTGLG